ncbi:MAG TPA: M23 family metallopeptidase [Anaerolineae bacterium]|nr:M23 family metallopeptidase [Anaerolineae bacterium]
MAKIHPRIGFHTAGAGGNPSGIGEHYVKRCHDAGVPVAITCADGTVGVMDSLANPHPDDIIIFRVVRDKHESFAVPDYGATPSSAAASYWDLILSFIPPELIPHKDKIWIAYGNELDQEKTDWIHWWSLEISKLMNAAGYKAIGPNWASGTPRYPDWESAGSLAFLRYCGQNPDKAAVGVHEYSYTIDDLFHGGGDKVGRYRHILKVCRDNGIGRPTILIKEFGYENARVASPSRIVADLGELYKKYPDYPPATLWWLGPWFGDVANQLQRAIEPVGDFVANTTFEFEAPKDVVSTPPPVVDEKAEEKPAIAPKKDRPPVKPNHRGIELDFFKVIDGKSDFRIHKKVWCEFRYNNTAGREIPYGGIGIAVHKWTGTEWVFAYYQHSYKGRVRTAGGPKPDGSPHDDGWKNVDVGIYALTPFLTFDELAQNKRKNPTAISEGFFMGPPIYIRIGSHIEPGGRIDQPPAPLFPEPELDEVVDPEDGDPLAPGAPGEEVSKPAGSLGEFLWNEGEGKRLLTLNPVAALQKVILNDGFLPVSEEFRTVFKDQPYVVQSAEHLGTGEKRVYYAAVGKWDDIRFVGSTIAAATTTFETPMAATTEPEKPKEELVEVKPAGFSFEFWPTDAKKVTQYFGARPEFYKKFGFPGHEGIDLASQMGTHYYAVAAGKITRVTDKRWDGRESAYGWHVVVDHGSGYSTLYAHAKPNPPVNVGDRVEAGQIIAYSGNTGNSSGPHLHLTLKKAGHTIPGWKTGYMDPWPFLEPIYNDLPAPTGDLVEGYLWLSSLELRGNKMAVTKLGLNMREKADKNSTLLGRTQPGATVRILNETPENGYLLCEASISKIPKKAAKVIPTGKRIDLLEYVRGDDRLYEVVNARGTQERFQTQRDGSTFYQTKNQNWEEFFFDDDFIYRDVDTSPGAGRYYRQKDADLPKGSRWLRRRMAEGETYTQARQVQFYMKNSGAKSAANSGGVTDTIKFVKHHKKHKFQTGIELDDVIELLWVNGRETYFYAKNYGLVGWRREHDDPHTPPWSAISEEHRPGQRPDNVREPVRIV